MFKSSCSINGGEYMGIELFLHNQIAYAQAIRLMETHGKAAVIRPVSTFTGHSLKTFPMPKVAGKGFRRIMSGF